MTDRAEEALRTAVDDLSADEHVSGDLRAAAEKVAQDFDHATCMEAAVLLLISEARHRWRLRTLELEREAMKAEFAEVRATKAKRTADAEVERLETKGFGHGSANRRNPCACVKCEGARAEVRDIDAKYARLRREAMDRVLDEYETMLRMEWSQELLDAGFALPDGSIRTWRAATVEDHRERMEMLKVNAVRNVEAAARHQSAIRAIEAAGARTLGEALTDGS